VPHFARSTELLDAAPILPSSMSADLKRRFGNTGKKVRFEAPDQSPVSVLPAPASKPATGTAAEISVPSIKKTRPCEADSRIFNTA
jgi:hypothetical protein